MRFVLYAKTDGVEQVFYDTESGSLEMAIIDPQLKIELNKAGSLEFKIMPTHPMYNRFYKMKTFVRVELDDEEIFRGRVLNVENDIEMEQSIKCEGDLAYLVDSLQPPQQKTTKNNINNTTVSNSQIRSQYGNHVQEKSEIVSTSALGDTENTSATIADQLRTYIETHNEQVEVEKQFTVGEITVDDVGEMSFSSSGYRETMTAITNDLLNQYRGYLGTRKNPNGPTYIDWLKTPGGIAQQPIVLGVNLVELDQKLDGDDVFTILVPTGDADLTVESVNDGNIGIENAEGIARFGRIYRTKNYSGIKDAAELLKLGTTYMDSNYKPDAVSLEVKAIDLHFLDGSIDMIRLGSTVKVISDPHGIEISLSCTSIEYDIQNPENNNYEIGDPDETLSRRDNSSRTGATAERRTGSRYSGQANNGNGSLEETINRHAKNIIDTADSTYRLEADLAQIHAKTIEITADEKVTVTTDSLIVNAKGKIEMTSEGNFILHGSTISLDADSTIEIDGLTIGCGEDGYFFFMGEANFYDRVYFIDGIDVNAMEGIRFGQDTTWINGKSVEAESIFYLGENAVKRVNLGGAVVGFGAGSADSSGVVSIPYNTADANNAGNITFNMAGTAWYIARAVASITANRISNITDSGSSVSATYRLHAKNADGNDITSSDVEISMSYSGGGGSASDIRVGAAQSSTTQPSGTNLSSLATVIHDTSSGDYIYFDTYLVDNPNNKKRYWFRLL